MVMSVDLTPPELAVAFTRGDDVRLRFAVQEADKTPIDVSGWAITAQIRSNADGPIETSWGVVKDGDDPSVFRLVLTNKQTAALGARVYHSDLECVDENGYVRTRVKMTITVSADVTRQAA